VTHQRGFFASSSPSFLNVIFSSNYSQLSFYKECASRPVRHGPPEDMYKQTPALIRCDIFGY